MADFCHSSNSVMLSDSITSVTSCSAPRTTHKGTVTGRRRGIKSRRSIKDFCAVRLRSVAGLVTSGRFLRQPAHSLQSCRLNWRTQWSPSSRCSTGMPGRKGTTAPSQSGSLSLLWKRSCQASSRPRRTLLLLTRS